MSRSKKKNTLHVILADGRTDKERIDSATGITQMAPQSALYTQNSQIKAAVDNVGTLTGDLKTQADTANGLQKQLDEAKGTLDTTRTKHGRAMGFFRVLAENTATTLDQLASLGLVGRIGAAPPAPITPPTGVKISLGTVHGQFRASAVSATGKKFGAQISPDPIGPATWIDLPGTGKRRIITGHPSGSLVWVRFRLLRGQGASDWCAAVPVTVP